MIEFLGVVCIAYFCLELSKLFPKIGCSLIEDLQCQVRMHLELRKSVPICHDKKEVDDNCVVIVGE